MKKVLLTLILFISVFTFAQVPQAFSYQAVVYNPNLVPVVNEYVHIKVSILDKTSDGVALYTETHYPKTNSKGLFNVFIGRGNVVSGDFSYIEWSINKKFIKIEADIYGADDFRLIGISELVSVPYAMHSNTSSNLILNSKGGKAFKLAVSDTGELTATLIENDSNLIELNGTYDQDLTLDLKNRYIITGPVIFTEGTTLTIPAGMTIKVKQGSNYLLISQGARIIAIGTSDKPITFESNSNSPAAGDWGGIIICGNATTTKGINAISETGLNTYGGSNPQDSSGTLHNVVIKHTGFMTTDSLYQFNSLSLYTVGHNTGLSNIAIIDGLDDGVQFYGGSVGISNLYVENNMDDAIDWVEGWDGSINNAYILYVKSPSSTALEGGEVNNNPYIQNLTAISVTGGGTALQFKEQSGATFTNLYLQGFDESVEIKHPYKGGKYENIIIDGQISEQFGIYQKNKLDISSWTWFKK